MFDDDVLLAALQSIDHRDFEKLLADLWSKQGWDTEVTSGSQDMGVDVIATKELPIENKILLQAKRYAEGTKVGSPEVQQYAGLLQQEKDVDSVLVVTTSTFTSGAIEVAEKSNLKLINGKKLCDIIHTEEAYGEIFRYSDPDSIPPNVPPEIIDSNKNQLDGFERLNIIPDCNVSYEDVDTLHKILRNRISANIEILNPINIPKFAFNKKRLQYNAENIMKTCEHLYGGKNGKNIIITGKDIYHGSKEYIFGLAYFGGDYSIISTYRLRRNEVLELDVIDDRIGKEALKMISNMVGQEYCREPRCLNNQVSTVRGLDATDYEFCNDCKKELIKGGIFE